jgi:hypothetical protein
MSASDERSRTGPDAAPRWASHTIEDELVLEINPRRRGRKHQPGSRPAIAIAFAVSDSPASVARRVLDRAVEGRAWR